MVDLTLACEGLGVVDEDCVLVADTPERFADSVIRLLRDKARRESLARRGLALVRERYDWTAIGATLDRALHSVAAARTNVGELTTSSRTAVTAPTMDETL